MQLVQQYEWWQRICNTVEVLTRDAPSAADTFSGNPIVKCLTFGEIKRFFFFSVYVVVTRI